jgi:Ca2+-binding RTX toxin-like protein
MTMINPVVPTTPTPISPELLEIFREHLQELTQDDNKSGFSNFGAGNNSITSSTNANLLLNTQAGNDTVHLSGFGNDQIFTGSGTDFVFAGGGSDQVSGGSGNDTLIGYDGNDRLSGGSGNDTLEGDAGTDVLSGGTGADRIFGGSGADIITGGVGDDEIFADHDGSPTSLQGNDHISGGFGNDKIHGGGGADVMFGNAGADQFIFDTANDFVFGHADFIGDFSHAEGDKIVLTPVDARSDLVGNQNFTFVDGPSTQAGTLWLGAVSDGTQHVFMNVNGGAADLDILVRLHDAGSTGLHASDFAL